MSDITTRRNKQKRWDITVLDDDGAVIDPATGVLTFKVKETTRDADPALVTKTSPAGGIVNVDATKARLTLLAADTLALNASGAHTKEYEYQLDFKVGAADPETVDSGKLYVEPDL